MTGVGGSHEPRTLPRGTRRPVVDELDVGRLVAVEVAGADMSRTLRAVWASGRRLGSEATDVLAVATLHAHARPGPART